MAAAARIAAAIRKKHKMSKANGDKSRFNRERRKKIARRVRARALSTAQVAAAAAPAKA